MIVPLPLGGGWLREGSLIVGGVGIPAELRFHARVVDPEPRSKPASAPHPPRTAGAALRMGEAIRRRTPPSRPRSRTCRLTAVTPPEILAELEKLAGRLGVVVRFDAFDAKLASKGGLCRLHGAPFVVIDGAIPILDKIGILSEALAMFDLEAIYLPPVLRPRLDRKRIAARGVVRPPLRPVAKAKLRGAR
jgi:hypothetical protein